LEYIAKRSDHRDTVTMTLEKKKYFALFKNFMDQRFVTGEEDTNGSHFGELAISPLSEMKPRW